MAYYDEQGFSQMQREALERMRDMQKRSKSLVFEQPKTLSDEKKESKPTFNRPPPKPDHHVNKPQSCKPGDAISSLFSGSGNIDAEKLLILILLFILYKNKADIKLILALGYLLI